MPTSIAHAIGGYAAASAAARAAANTAANANADAADPPLRLREGIILAILIANVPDLDFLPGLLLGHAERFHRGASHSLVAAVLVSMMVAPLVTRVLGGNLRHWSLLLFAAYVSHLGLDLLMRDPSGGAGVAVLWPLTDVRYALNLPGQSVLDPIRTLDTGFFTLGIPEALLRANTIQVFLVDGLLVAPLLFFSYRWRGRADGRTKAGDGVFSQRRRTMTTTSSR